jgi:hypothetical protein
MKILTLLRWQEIEEIQLVFLIPPYLPYIEACDFFGPKTKKVKIFVLHVNFRAVSKKRSFCSVSILDDQEFSPEPLHKRGTGCIPTSCTLEKVSEYQSRQKSAFYRRKSTSSRWLYRLRKMRRSLKATYLSQFKALLKPKILCDREHRTGVGKTAI